MKWTSVREISETVIETFLCSDEIMVQEFFCKKAKKYDYEMLAKTTVLIDNAGLAIGYFTLFNDITEVGVKKASQLSWDLYRESFNQFPAIRLHYIGLHSDYRGIGLGRVLLRQALQTVISVSRRTGCVFIVTEAINDNIISFNEHFGFKTLRPRRLKSEPQIMALRIKDLL